MRIQTIMRIFSPSFFGEIWKKMEEIGFFVAKK